MNITNRAFRILALFACAALSAAVAPAAVTPAEAQQRLAAGQARFTSGQPIHPNQDHTRRTAVASGQTPFATILTCADSRVAPEILFDQGLGDLFVVRVAGNVSKTDEIGSVEYGTGHLGSQFLVVLGHSSCGAVKAVLEGAQVHGSIPELVAPIVPAVEKAKTANPGLPGAQLLAKAVEANVWQSIDDLLSNSATLRDLVKAGKLKVVGAVYDLANGSVQWQGEHPEQARLLASADKEEHAAHASTAADAHPTTAPHAAAEEHPAAAPEIHATSLGYPVIAGGALLLALLLAGAHRYSLTGMKRWTVNARLVAGFASILIVLAGLALESYHSLHTALTDFTEYRSDARHGMLVGRIQANFLEMRLAAKDFQITKAPADIETYGARKTKVTAFIAEGKTELAQETERHDRLAKIEGQIREHAAGFATLTELGQRGASPGQLAAAGRKLAPIGESVGHEIEALKLAIIGDQNAAGPRIAAELQHTQSIVIWLGLAAIALGVGLATIIARSITAPLRLLAASLGAGADQTASASGQVSSASQSLAQGASEQAASLEEASASMEELSSMTKRNADNSQEAKKTTTETRAVADTGAGHMQAMETAMQAIKSASTDITKILKTIDEIVFQTNILALNAAVEAARAGEHGMGFAVVAEEVRALAQRSALAAKETATKIEDSVNKSQQGVHISSAVAKSFTEIQTRIQRLDHLMGEIASASGEQTQGIGQMTTAISQMDQVTQTNAGSAEETAAAAEELNSQAVMLRESVGELEALTGVRSITANATRAPAPSPARPASKPALQRPKFHATFTRTRPHEPVSAGASDEFFK